MQYDGFAAWVEADGVPLEEYEIEMDKRKSKLWCYIPSQAGKEFAVAWVASDLPDDGVGIPAMRGTLSIDGHECQSIIATGLKAKVTRVRVDGTDVRVRPKFTCVQLTDEETPESVLEERALKAMGSLELVLEFGHAKRRRPYTRKNPNTLPDARPIFEELKKAGSHQVIAGQVTERVRSRKTLDRHRTREDITFVFLYRSRDILLAKEIIPRTDDPVSQDDVTQDHVQCRNTPVTLDSDEEVEVLREHEQALEAQLAVVREKRMHREAGQSHMERLKFEEMDAHLFFQPREVIDLTID